MSESNLSSLYSAKTFLKERKIQQASFLLSLKYDFKNVFFNFNNAMTRIFFVTDIERWWKLILKNDNNILLKASYIDVLNESVLMMGWPIKVAIIVFNSFSSLF